MLSPSALIPGFELAYRLRQPQPAAPRRALVLLHGVGGNENHLEVLADGVADDVLVVLVRAPLQLAPGQYAWFNVTFGADGPTIDAEQAEASRLQLIRFIGELQQHWHIAPANTVVAGFSQGGILSASVALTAPQQVGGFAILSGRILPELRARVAPREQLAHLSAFIGHGEYDSKLPFVWAERSEQWLARLGIDYRLQRYPIDHGISAAMRADFVEWFAGCDAEPAAAPRDIRLDIGDAHSMLTLPDGTVLPLGPGSEALAARHFHHTPPTPLEMEQAIVTVEDALAPIKVQLPAAARFVSADAGIGAIARLAGLAPAPAADFSRQAIERTFGRLTAVVEGQPAAHAGLPTDPVFAARLLILRELMHHLDVTGIRCRIEA